MPFKSEKQRRYMWKKRPDLARKWTEEYGSQVSKKGWRDQVRAVEREDNIGPAAGVTALTGAGAGAAAYGAHGMKNIESNSSKWWTGMGWRQAARDHAHGENRPTTVRAYQQSKSKEIERYTGPNKGNPNKGKPFRVTPGSLAHDDFKNAARAAQSARRWGMGRNAAIGVAGASIPATIALAAKHNKDKSKKKVSKASPVIALKPLGMAGPRDLKTVQMLRRQRVNARALKAAKKHFARDLSKRYSATKIAGLSRQVAHGGPIHPKTDYARAMLSRKQYGMVGDKREGQVSRIHSEYFGARAAKKGKKTLVLRRKKPRQLP